MDLHSGARTCPRSRALLIERIAVLGWTVGRAASAAGISRQTAHKWLARYRAAGEAGLTDRPSRPRRMPRRTPTEWRQLMLELRRSRLSGARIATQLRRPRSTVARVLQRAGLARLERLEPREPVRRYERARPGELLHLDVKKLGRITGFYGHRITGDRHDSRRGAGWEYVHVAIDDYSRLAYVEVLRDERGDTTAAFLRRACAWFLRHGIRVERIMSDNGSAYVSRRFAHTCAVLQLKHLRTRPYRPCTNGKAERFIQTLLREWAYAVPYRTSGLRARALRRFLRYYNRERPHGSLCGRPPISRLRTADCQQRA
jgi:transposase InsO family protein